MQAPFNYDAHALGALASSVSADRLRRYEDIAAGDIAQALRLYMWNTALSESLYGPMQGLEVTLRNKIHERLSGVHGPAWYDVPEMRLQFAQTEQIQRAKQQLQQQQKPLEPGRVVAELNFGFWVGLLGSKYETNLWRPHLRWVFANAPERFRRKDAHRVLDEVRWLRNRVAHHEAILQRQLGQEHGLILTAVAWLCPITASWVRHHSRFETVYAARP